MRLFEHPDFEQAVIRAAEHFNHQGLRPAIIEKDYYVTVHRSADALSTILACGQLQKARMRSQGRFKG